MIHGTCSLAPCSHPDTSDTECTRAFFTCPCSASFLEQPLRLFQSFDPLNPFLYAPLGHFIGLSCESLRLCLKTCSEDILSFLVLCIQKLTVSSSPTRSINQNKNLALIRHFISLYMPITAVERVRFHAFYKQPSW
jgi:hypothetical protein